MYGEEMGRPASSGVAEMDFWAGLNRLAFYGVLLATVVVAILFVVRWLSYLLFTSTSVLAMAGASTSESPSWDGTLIILGATQMGFIAAILGAAVVRDISGTQDRIAASLSPAPQ